MAMTSVRQIFVDTNILIRATIDAAPLHQECRTMLDALWDEHAELYISHQVVREYVANTTRPQAYSPALPIADVLAQVEDFRNTFRILAESAAVLNNLLALIGSVSVGGKQVHDANIVATMQAYNLKVLLTHNISDFERFKMIQILPITA